jgi:hypothetical protein
LDAAPASIVVSDSITLDGFEGPLLLSISPEHDAQYSIDEGTWSNLPVSVYAGDSIRVRHLSAANVGDVAQTTLSVGLANGATETQGVFVTVTSEPDNHPDAFDFGTKTDVPGSTLIESDAIFLTGYNLPVEVVCGPHAEYRIHGGVWTTEPGILQPRQTLQMRHVSNKKPRSVRRTHVRVGCLTGHFTTRTGAN